jgi:hypothetical protein
VNTATGITTSETTFKVTTRQQQQRLVGKKSGSLRTNALRAILAGRL